jgi:hypothetical protein
MSGLSEAVYASRRKIEDVAEEQAERTIELIEDALFSSIKAIWDESPPELDMQDDDYYARAGIRWGLARLCKDFDLQERLLEHDEDAERYL